MADHAPKFNWNTQVWADWANQNGVKSTCQRKNERPSWPTKNDQISLCVCSVSGGTNEGIVHGDVFPGAEMTLEDSIEIIAA